MSESTNNSADERRKRINRYKKIIIYAMMALIMISVILWIIIFYKVSKIDTMLMKQALKCIIQN